MKRYLFLLLTTFLTASHPPLPVPHVDAEKFSGLWYEVARTYNRYEKECVASTVEYQMEGDESYKVHNRCFRKVIGGELIEYEGKAEPSNDFRSMSEIDITYYYIFTQQYLVLHLEEDYSAAVVADEAMERVWIMSREPQVEAYKLQIILSKLEKHMDLSRLIYTPQDEKGRYR